jgi:hypothetical protein
LKLKDFRPKLIVALEEESRGLMETFNKEKPKLMEFWSYHDLSQADMYASLARTYHSNLNKLSSLADQLNYNQKFLKSQVTDFSAINDSLKEFKKVLTLWEFAERWRGENWMLIPFSALDEKDLMQNLKDGTDLLQGLDEDFRGSPSIQVRKIILK